MKKVEKAAQRKRKKKERKKRSMEKVSCAPRLEKNGKKESFVAAVAAATPREGRKGKDSGERGGGRRCLSFSFSFFAKKRCNFF